MNAEEMLSRYREKSRRKTVPMRLRTKEYREHYRLVKESIGRGVSLHFVVQALKEDGAFPGRKPKSVYQAYRRALKHDGIDLRQDVD